MDRQGSQSPPRHENAQEKDWVKGRAPVEEEMNRAVYAEWTNPDNLPLHPCEDFTSGCLRKNACRFARLPKGACLTMFRRGYCYAGAKCANKLHIADCVNGRLHLVHNTFVAEGTRLFRARMNSIELEAMRKAVWDEVTNRKRQREERRQEEALKDVIVSAQQGNTDQGTVHGATVLLLEKLEER